MSDFQLKVWRLHPQGVRLVPADTSLNGHAIPRGVKYCGPYKNANKFGFWVFPPLDIDFILHEDGTFEHHILSPWENDEMPLMKGLIRATDSEDKQLYLQSFGGRMKVAFGRFDTSTLQIWTGVCFETPPGWALQLRSPINLNMGAPYHIQEAILETDWLTYDIWMNITILRRSEWIRLRREQWPPLAQLVPVPRDAYDQQWTLQDNLINRETADGDRIFAGWADYNYKKYIKVLPEKDKDSALYFKERAKHLGKRLPVQEADEAPAEPRLLAG